MLMTAHLRENKGAYTLPWVFDDIHQDKVTC